MVVQVSDGLDAGHNQDAAIDDTITVTVNLTNVDEAGRVVLSSLEPEVDTEITATLNDSDGSVSVSSWQWAKSSDDGSTWTDIADATSDTYTPTSDEAEMHLRAAVSYTDGEGTRQERVPVGIHRYSGGTCRAGSHPTRPRRCTPINPQGMLTPASNR